MAVQQQTRGKIPWGRWLIVLAVVAVIIAGSILWIIENNGPWISILPIIIFTALGVIIALLQWLFPVSSDTSSPPLSLAHVSSPLQTPHHHVSPSMVTPPTNATNPIVPPPAEQSPPVGKTAYRSIVGVPPPTDSRTIQQREKAVKEIYGKLIQHDISAIALTGIGGVGKSTLAALVYSYAEGQRHARKGPLSAPALWLKIDSTAVTMTDLVGTIFDALGKPLPDLSSLAPHNQAATLYNALNDVDDALLIVLDQFENLLDPQTGYAMVDRPGIGEWLDAINSQPCRSRMLLTSRPWPQGTRGYPPTYMQEYHVTGLETSEGIDLLRKLGVNAPEAELHIAVERCAGHVYALTLLAALLRNRHLSLSTFFKEQAYAQLWTGNVARNLLDHIYKQQLDDIQRKLLLAFSVYREPVVLDAARTIADVGYDITTNQIQLALDGLLAQRLLQPAGEGLYQLHTIVTNYAHDHFDTKSEQANQQTLKVAHARAAYYYQQYAALHCPRREMRHQRSDVQPLVEAVWQLCQAEQWQEGYELMEREGLSTDLRIWGSNVLLLELYQLLLPLEKWQPAEAEHVYNEVGEMYRLLGRMQDARYYFDLALALSKAKKNRREEGYALNNIGRVYADSGDKRQALGYYEEALEAYKEVGDLVGEGAVINNLAWVYDDFGNRKLALEKYEQALAICREAKDRYDEARLLNSIGCIYAKMEQTELAEKYHEQALPIMQELGSRGGEAWTLNNLGRVYENKGDLKLALEYLQEALRIRRETGNRHGEGATLNNMNRIYNKLGQYELALEYGLQSLNLRREVGDRHGEGKTLNSLGHSYELLGQIERACMYYKESLRVRQTLDQRDQKRRVGRTLSNLGRCYTRLDRDTLALACFLYAIKLFEESQQLGVDDTVVTKDMEATQRSIDTLSQKVSEEQFIALLEQVKPQADQIVEQDLQRL